MTIREHDNICEENYQETNDDIFEDKSEEIFNGEQQPIVQPVIELGKVVDCFKVNVRSEPDINSSVECIINCDDYVEVHMNESTQDFYKVFIEEKQVYGFIMKQYIRIV